MALIRFLFLHPPSRGSVVGLIFFSLLVWFGGPVVSMSGYEPFTEIPARVLLILVFLFAGLVVKYHLWRRDQGSNMHFIESLLAAYPGDVRAGDTQERKVLTREAAYESIAAHENPGSARKRPWFFVLGGRQCGKSSIVRNFTITANHFLGSGITRDYDWWTNNAGVPLLEIPVFRSEEIPGAGESVSGDQRVQLLSEVVQGSNWRQFLDAVSRGRPEKPVNGVLLVVSLSELQHGDPRAIEEYASALRKRLDDMQRRLSARVPCYLVFSKADSIKGFSEFFSGLSPDERNQVWGLTFAAGIGVGASAKPKIEQLKEELDLLVDHLDRPRLRRLSGERELSRRFLVFGFPWQFSRVGKRINVFAKELVRDRPGQPGVFLRGIYFTAVAPLSKRQAKEGFFISDIFEGIILRESDLVVSTAAKTRMKRRLFVAGYVLLVGIVAAALLGWGMSLYLLQQQADAVRTKLDVYSETISKFDTGQQTDLRQLVGALGALRGASVKAAELPGGIAGFGLSDGARVVTAAQRAYTRALRMHLYTYVQKLIEAQLRAPWLSPASLRKALDAYLMLESWRPGDAPRLKEWVMRNLPAVVVEDKRVSNRFERHLRALLKHPLPSAVLDSQLIEDVSARLAESGP